jgi:GntR family transcriptional repressor for pyruvate dehydrogenase complex
VTSNFDGGDTLFISREGLAAHLEDKIVSGKLEAGSKLPPERRLAERFNVSRPVVREALRSLVERNLVEVVPGRGAYVRRVSMTDATRPLAMLFQRRRPTPRDLVEARRMLECEAASLAAIRAEPEHLRAMQRALVLTEQVRADLLEKVGHDLAFHASIARASRNPVIETMFVSITGTVAELMLRSLGDPDVSRVGLPYHREIYEAIKNGEPDEARAAMAGHLSVAERTYGGDYDRPLDALARRELRHRLDANAVLGLLSALGDDRPSGDTDR